MMQKKILEKFSLTTREALFNHFSEELSLIQQGTKISTPELRDRLLAVGFESVLEEVCYTWFNRLIILRYLELHQILSSDLLARPIWRSSETLVSACEAAANFLPQIFASQTTFCDSLSLDFLFQSAGIISELLSLSKESFDETEVLGWFYQYYNSTRRAKVVAKKEPYLKSEIPLATQIFTPKWISKFLVENSLGRYYLELGGDAKLKEQWNFYNSILEEGEDNYSTQMSADKTLDLHQLTFLDSCCGSGHILGCAFDMFYQIYLAAGHQPSEIPEQILTYNLFGLDIDQRAVQLAITTVLLRAYQYDHSIFQKEIAKNLHIYDIPESNSIGKTYVDSITSENSRDEARKLFDYFVDAKNLGSLLMPEPYVFSALQQYINEDQSEFGERRRAVLRPMLDVHKILSKKYSVVVTNPPYLKSGAMNAILKNFVIENFPEYKRDLFTAFTARCNYFLKDKNSYLGLMTPITWLFTAQFRPFRNEILQKNCIKVLIQPYKNAFFDDAAVEICAFVLKNSPTGKGNFMCITEQGDMSIQEQHYLQQEYQSSIHQNQDFQHLPEQKILYGLDRVFIKIFSEQPTLSNFAETKPGIVTSDNDKYLRRWHEVPPRKLNKKWLPHSKGGSYRKWYGNQEYVINWSNSLAEFKKLKRSKIRASRPQNLEYNFRAHLGWSAVSGTNFAVRSYDESFTLNVAGPGCFSIKDSDQLYLMGLLNSCVGEAFAKILNPTLNFNPGDIAKIPVIMDDTKRPYIEELVTENIELAKQDWNNFETSWDFRTHPLLRYSETATIKSAFERWQAESNHNFQKMFNNETELNRIFSEIYHLESTLKQKIIPAKTSLRKADQKREIKSLLSFFMGYLFGRFQLPSDSRAQKKISLVLLEDIVPCLKDFLTKAYGAATVEGNLDYIAEVLEKEFNECSEATILRYFTERFYTDHLQTYHNLPIFWQLDSGPERVFRAFFYCHNYNIKILAEVAQKHLPSEIQTYQLELANLSNQLSQTQSKSDQKWLLAKQKRLEKQLAELENFNSKILQLCDKNPKLNFDNGIRTNYQQLQTILTKLPK